MAKPEDYIIETFRDVEFFLPELNSQYAKMLASWEKGTLEEDFPMEAKKLAQAGASITPWNMHSALMYAPKGYGTKPVESGKPGSLIPYKSDKDGTIRVKAEHKDHAIHIWRSIHKLDPRCHFNEKYGLPCPQEIRDELDAIRKEATRVAETLKRLSLAPRSVHI